MGGWQLLNKSARAVFSHLRAKFAPALKDKHITAYE